MESPNHLINASSPYLLQHAYNPVEWYEWGEEALAKARKENKLILVSIGYSACHWCHVMERESFEDYEVAEVMNKNYVCIKVDREERPDIDQIYMYAVQLMTGAGGWPLNCICLPDQRPIYGGTYFKKQDWISVLEHVQHMWLSDPDKAKDYAARLTAGIHESEKALPNFAEADFQMDHLQQLLKPWKNRFDTENGGYLGAPKFPLPNNWLFLFRMGFLYADEALFSAATHTLEQMAMGGIYDHVGGGFARYTVDAAWHIPHFEKMLYDNAQLIALYAEAYQCLKLPAFKQAVYQSIDWLFREMQSPQGLFYAALDADSEGVEGKFYTWSQEEFEAVLVGEDLEFLKAYYNITPSGNWEEENINILRNLQPIAAAMEKTGLDEAALKLMLDRAKNKLLQRRTQRVRPGLDDKCLSSWNGMTIKALAEVSQVFNDKYIYEQAKRAMLFILKNLRMEDGGLYRNYKNNKAGIAGFLDDYAFNIEALIALYSCDFEEYWLQEAVKLTDYVLEHFADDFSPMFFYTSNLSENLIARKHELMDNVMPSSNSVMAQNLKKLGLLYDQQAYLDRASDMLNAVLPQMSNYGSAYSNWAIQLLNEVYGLYEIAITGQDQGIAAAQQDLNAQYIPSKIVLGGTKSTLPLLRNKESEATKVYICQNKVCQLPEASVQLALKHIH